MVRNVQISEELYQRLEQMARDRGVASIEDLMERLAPETPSKQHAARQDLVDRIHEHRRQLLRDHGQFDDSVPLVRADRER